MAVAKGLLGKSDDGLKYAKQSLVLVKKMKNSNIQFHLSTIDIIKNTNDNLEEVQKKLTHMILEFQAQIDNN